ncbi:MAG: preprotein translocase subunit SecE [Candidatus Promineifilaceae bacterium]
MKSENRAAATQPNTIARYVRETRGELRKVTWPSAEESRRLTAIVIGVTIVMAIFLGFWDLVFSRLVEAIIRLLVGG